MMSPFVESYNRLWPPHPELNRSTRDAVWIVAVDGELSLLKVPASLEGDNSGPLTARVLSRCPR